MLFLPATINIVLLDYNIVPCTRKKKMLILLSQLFYFDFSVILKIVIFLRQQPPLKALQSRPPPGCLDISALTGIGGPQFVSVECFLFRSFSSHFPTIVLQR